MRGRAAILLNAEPAPCRPPIIFEPPQPLVDRPELWTITTGPREQWGGALVGWSEDQDHYEAAPMVEPNAVMGTLLDALTPEPNAQGVCIALEDEGRLASVNEAAARRLQSECYLGNGRNSYELVAFTGARLLGREGTTFVYRLEGLLIRGAYGTAVRAWPAGTRFARLDGNVSRLVLPYRLVAARATLSLKIASLNAAGDYDALDDPAEADPISFTLAGLGSRRTETWT